MSLQLDEVDLRDSEWFLQSMAKPEDRAAALAGALDQLRRDTKAAAETVYALAKAKDWTQARLAKEAGYDSVSTFSNWKKGHEIPNLQNLLPFAVAVGASVRVTTYGGPDEQTGGLPLTEDAIKLAKLYDELGETEQAELRGYAASLRSRPSEPVAHEKGQRDRQA